MTKKIVTMAEATSFLSKRGAWSPVEKRAQKVLLRGLDDLETFLDKTDLDDKTRLLAIDKAITHSKDIIDLGNKDVMTRMIAEIRFVGKLPNGGSTVDDDESEIPLIDFATIREP